MTTFGRPKIKGIENTSFIKIMAKKEKNLNLLIARNKRHNNEIKDFRLGNYNE